MDCMFKHSMDSDPTRAKNEKVGVWLGLDLSPMPLFHVWLLPFPVPTAQMKTTRGEGLGEISTLDGPPCKNTPGRNGDSNWF